MCTNIHMHAPTCIYMHLCASVCTKSLQCAKTCNNYVLVCNCALLCALMHCKVQLCATYVHRMRCTNLLLWVPVCTNMRRYAPNVHQMFNNAHLSAPMCTNVHLCAVNISICNTSVFKNIIYSSSLHKKLFLLKFLCCPFHRVR